MHRVNLFDMVLTRSMHIFCAILTPFSSKTCHDIPSNRPLLLGILGCPLGQVLRAQTPPSSLQTTTECAPRNQRHLPRSITRNWFEGEESRRAHSNATERTLASCAHSASGVVPENDRCSCISDRLLLWKIFVSESEYFLYVAMSHFVWVRHLTVPKLVSSMSTATYLLNSRRSET
uniref:Uncharacterized protein n=1 Tax=Physcomitrium patens TaxID=3218 RepID=A0A2K1KEF3_PHYPA|nr:hypothetical protein PHYPA_008522 [Physcomitrium patens]PNR52150.1 hypothetical protein PHYPA_008524 [Physcomitrium patens]